MESYWFNIKLTLLQKLKIQLRIADEKAGYPFSEAMYTSIIDYESRTGKSFGVELEILERAADGAF